MNNLINIRNLDGILTVSSREIAENFNKRHDKLSSEIERMYGDYIYDPEQDKSTLNGGNPLFIRNWYIHPQNKQRYKEYLLTRDGFSLLVMGFTGEKNLQWKLDYIKAFNKLEKEFTKLQEDSVTMLPTTLQELEQKFLTCRNEEEMRETFRKAIDVATNIAIEKERDGNGKIINLSSIINTLQIKGLTPTLFSEWLCHLGFGTMSKYVISGKKVFTPSEKFFDVLVKEGYSITGQTLNGGIKVLYTTKMIDYANENIDSLKDFMKR